MKKIKASKEILRIKTLLSYEVLDSAPEEEFQELVQLIAAICDVPVAIISMLDANRQWYKAKVGMEETELPKDQTICQYTLLQNEVLEITNALQDERVKENPFVKAENGIRFYAGISLQSPNGYNIGTVCVADMKPRKLSDSQKSSLKLLSRQVMALLEARRKNRNLSEELEKILNNKIKEAEEKLFLKENEYQHLLESIKRSNSIVEFSPEGYILSTNAIFRSFIGYSETEITGKHHSHLVDPEQAVKNEKFWKSLSNGNFKAGRFKRIRKNGDEVWMQATYNPVKAPDGRVHKILKIAQDITAEIEAEKAMERAREAAEFLNRQKDSFIANMSHEIRTPIHAVLGFTELLLEQEKDPQKLTYLKSVKTAGDNLMFIINDILDLSKIEAGIIQMHSANFKLKQVVENVFSILHLKAKQKQLKLNYTISPEVPEFLLGDSNRLSQILLNLLGNALKFTQQGKVELEVSLSGRQHEKYLVHFSVTDTGMGIAQDKLEKIFQRFSQADERIFRTYGGTGLGLNISKQLVERQNGTIWVESREGEGSKFTFSIPYAAGDSREMETEAAEASELSFITGRILLCEDNELNQRLIEAILKEKNYTIDIAGNGLEGIKLLKKNEYDLVLMDLQMPQLDGRETTRMMRRELRTAVPVIALTANFLNKEREKCLQDGMNDYLSKPFKKEDLFEIINRWINKYRQEKLSVRSFKGHKAILSMEHLEEMSGGNLEFQQEMISLFLKTSEEILEQMRFQFNEGNFSEIGRLAHKFKGSLGLIGADLTLLQKLEEVGDPVEIEDGLLALEAQISGIFKILKN